VTVYDVARALPAIGALRDRAFQRVQGVPAGRVPATDHVPS
jgi:hypothetical protein